MVGLSERQGFGFIEFRQESVAKIVAQTMNKILGLIYFMLE